MENWAKPHTTAALKEQGAKSEACAMENGKLKIENGKLGKALYDRCAEGTRSKERGLRNGKLKIENGKLGRKNLHVAE